MKNFFYVILLFLCKVVNAQKTQSVILISIDGLRPEFYEDKSWSAPNLQQLAEQNACAKQVRSVFPSFTYPAHVAMLSGALPARSGIHYNAKPSTQQWYWFVNDVKVPMIWDVLLKKEMKTAAVQWPVSVTDKITYNIPEIWDTLHPSDRITATRKYATKGLIEDIERNATGKLDSSIMNEEGLGLDDNAGRMAAYIFKKYKPNLLAVHFAGVDGKQHQYGRDHKQVHLAVANVDHAIGVILEAVEKSGVKENTTILIVGDHGFSNSFTIIRPNVWLKEKGLLEKARFQPAGGSAFLYLNQQTDSATLKEVVSIAESAIEQTCYSVYDRSKLDSMGADPNAVLALAAKPGYVFSGGTNPVLASQTSGGHHGYDPNHPEMMTGFIAAGAGINKGVVIQDMCVTDIAPLIATLLGIEFRVLDGKLIPNLLKK